MLKYSYREGWVTRTMNKVYENYFESVSKMDKLAGDLVKQDTTETDRYAMFIYGLRIRVMKKLTSLIPEITSMSRKQEKLIVNLLKNISQSTLNTIVSNVRKFCRA